MRAQGRIRSCRLRRVRTSYLHEDGRGFRSSSALSGNLALLLLLAPVVLLCRGAEAKPGMGSVNSNTRIALSQMSKSRKSGEDDSSAFLWRLAFGFHDN